MLLGNDDDVDGPVRLRVVKGQHVLGFGNSLHGCSSRQHFIAVEVHDALNPAKEEGLPCLPE